MSARLSRDAKRTRGPNLKASRPWQKARACFLRQHPLCAMCQEDGHLTPASVVDHIKPHRGDLALFWDESNWQPLCATHHNSTKQREERGAGPIGCDVHGNPRRGWR